MVIFTQMDEYARDRAKRGELQYRNKSHRTSQDLTKLLLDAKILEWRRFGSGQTGTAIATSDMDIQVKTDEEETQTMRDIIRNTGHWETIQDPTY